MTISACVITKDEEANIANYIESLQPYVNEIVLIDTGSSDRTVQIAKKYGVNIYQYAWCNDFAAAKNFAISKAKGDWIVFLDADEYFSAETVNNLLLLLDQHGGKYEVFLTKIINIDIDNENKYLDEFYTVRIFRNLPQIKYIGRIHEQVRAITGNDLNIKIISDEELLIYHTGYSESRNKLKAKRNLTLLLEEFENSKNKEQYYAYLAETYDGLDDYKNAVYYAILDIESGKKANTYVSKSYRILIENLKNLNVESENLRQIIEKSIKDFPELPDFWAEYGLFFYQQKDYSKACIYFEKALCLNENYTGIEPSLLKNSLTLLNKILLDAQQKVFNEGNKYMNNDFKFDNQLIEKLYFELKNNKESEVYNNVIAEIVDKVQKYIIVLLLNPYIDINECKQLLPKEMHKIVKRFYNQLPSLNDDDFDIYKTLLWTIINFNDQSLLDKYLLLSADFSIDIRYKIVKILYKNKQFKMLANHFDNCLLDEFIEADMCYWAGIVCYYKKYYDKAEVYFKRAILLGTEQKDIDSYLTWIQERR